MTLLFCLYKSNIIQIATIFSVPPDILKNFRRYCDKALLTKVQSKEEFDLKPVKYTRTISHTYASSHASLLTANAEPNVTMLPTNVTNPTSVQLTSGRCRTGKSAMLRK
jgi:hypothetical protein